MITCYVSTMMTIFIRCKFALQATKLAVAFNGAVCGFKYKMNGAKNNSKM
jgi:hypothetical protein